MDLEIVEHHPQQVLVRQERCYKMVTLLHRRGHAHVYAGATLLPGNHHEAQPLFELVDKFASKAGRGVIKWLVLDPRIYRRRTDQSLQRKLGY